MYNSTSLVTTHHRPVTAAAPPLHHVVALSSSIGAPSKSIPPLKDLLDCSMHSIPHSMVYRGEASYISPNRSTSLPIPTPAPNLIVLHVVTFVQAASGIAACVAAFLTSLNPKAPFNGVVHQYSPHVELDGVFVFVSPNPVIAMFRSLACWPKLPALFTFLSCATGPLKMYLGPSSVHQKLTIASSQYSFLDTNNLFSLRLESLTRNAHSTRRP